LGEWPAVVATACSGDPKATESTFHPPPANSMTLPVRRQQRHDSRIVTPRSKPPISGVYHTVLSFPSDPVILRVIRWFGRCTVPRCPAVERVATIARVAAKLSVVHCSWSVPAIWRVPA
jgi:hypothetical protein